MLNLSISLVEIASTIPQISIESNSFFEFCAGEKEELKLMSWFLPSPIFKATFIRILWGYFNLVSLFDQIFFCCCCVMGQA